MQLSKKALAISPSLTLKITAMANDLKAQGKDIVSFGAGEPDFDTPQHIKDAAVRAMDKGLTKYTPASGAKELKEAICDFQMRENGLKYVPEQIVISNGAKHSLFNVFQAILNPGDEVIIIEPYWLSYPELVKMADGVPVFVEAKEKHNFEPTEQDIRAAVTERTRIIIVNNPSNPCGCVYSEDTLHSIAKIAKEFNFYIISDEIYGELVYDGHVHKSIATISEDAYNRTIIVNGLSKSYAMTGWRIGYTASNLELAKVMGSFQSHSTSNASSISQYAGVEALTGRQDELLDMRKEFNRRRLELVKDINEIEGISCNVPMGAFYVMVNISELKGKYIDGKKIESSIDFAEQLLKKTQTAVIPGAPFGADDYVRLSYAISIDDIKKGTARIAEFVNMLTDEPE